MQLFSQSSVRQLESERNVCLQNCIHLRLDGFGKETTVYRENCGFIFDKREEEEQSNKNNGYKCQS